MGHLSPRLDLAKDKNRFELQMFVNIITRSRLFSCLCSDILIVNSIPTKHFHESELSPYQSTAPSSGGSGCVPFPRVGQLWYCRQRRHSLDIVGLSSCRTNVTACHDDRGGRKNSAMPQPDVLVWARMNVFFFWGRDGESVLYSVVGLPVSLC